MLAKGGFAVKCWQFSGESSPRSGGELCTEHTNHDGSDGSVQKDRNMLKGTDGNLRVLGLGWNPEKGTVVFEATLSFSKKRKGM